MALDPNYYDSDDVELTRQDEKKIQDERNTQNNAQNLRNAADIAIASGEGHAVAIGGAVKTADKLTGGASTELLGKALNARNKLTPGGRIAQGVLNKANESGLGDKVGKAASLKNQFSTIGNKGGGSPNQVKNPKVEGGDQKGSLPSSTDKKDNLQQQKPQEQAKSETEEKSKNSADKFKEKAKEKAIDAAEDIADKRRKSREEQKAEDQEYGGFARFKISPVMKVALIAFLPFILIVIPIIVIVGGVMGNMADFEDAYGISYITGGNTGGVQFTAQTEEQQKFYERVNEVKESNLQKGRYVDALKVVAVFHVLSRNGADMTYQNMTTDKIQDIIECMYNGSSSTDEILKSNLISYLIPKYLPNSSDSERVRIADEVFKYIEDYYEFIGEDSNGCATSGSCTYDIKGFYIAGRGNVAKNIEVNDLYVRLMQCGKANGHDYGGTFGLPLEGEDLVPFETYILGVAYQEIGPSAPAEAIKAQMIAARSYILARPTVMNDWRTLKQENGKWIIQVASCTSDQVFCNPDKGCSARDGQWSQVYSGQGHGIGLAKRALAEDAPMRTYARETQGETLVNAQGYIIYTSYIDKDQRNWINLAKSGLNYKQILLQHYNQSKKYGASTIQKASCGGGGICAPSGAAASWRQNEGPWVNTPIGNSGKTIGDVGCLVTSLAIQVSRSGVSTNVSGEFNPGSFVEYLNSINAFDKYGNYSNYSSVESVAPSFKYQNFVELKGMSRQEKLNTIASIVNQTGVYAIAEVKGNTGQHWVAIESVNGDTINMMDPGTSATNMWNYPDYRWENTSRIVYYKVS